MASVGVFAAQGMAATRALAFSERARRFGLPEPRGLLCSAAGAGKAWSPRRWPAQWQLPLLRMTGPHVQRAGRLVGAEHAHRPAAGRVGLAGHSVAGRAWRKGLLAWPVRPVDAGTTARVFGGFLTGCQEKTAPSSSSPPPTTSLSCRRGPAQGPFRRDFLHRPAGSDERRARYLPFTSPGGPRPRSPLTSTAGPAERGLLGRRDRAGGHLRPV